jgi:hypothetical protein
MRVMATAVLICCLASPAAASEAHKGHNGTIVVTDRADGSEGGAPVREPGQHDFAYWRLVPTTEGFCRVRQFTADEALARAYDYLYERRGRDANNPAGFGPCPPDAAGPAAPDPGQMARDFWDVRRLPAPTLKVVPDYGIVGKRVYLQIAGPPAATFEVPNPIGVPVGIAATSRYVVDWGDGTPPTTTTGQGGPWPDGDVTHVYDTAHPAVTIRVTQQWSATWTAGATTGGTLENLRTEGELTIRVDQLQPVRNR